MAEVGRIQLVVEHAGSTVRWHDDPPLNGDFAIYRSSHDDYKTRLRLPEHGA